MVSVCSGGSLLEAVLQSLGVTIRLVTVSLMVLALHAALQAQV